MRNILTDTVPDNDPDTRPARRGVQLPYPNKCNSMLTSGTRGETLSPNECHSMPPSVIPAGGGGGGGNFHMRSTCGCATS